MEWDPNNWLSYSKPQTITGFFYLNELITKDLEVKSGNVFEDALLLNEEEKLFGNVIIGTLKAKKAYLSKINNISFNDIYFQSEPRLIKGTKTYNHLQVATMILDTINGVGLF